MVFVSPTSPPCRAMYPWSSGIPQTMSSEHRGSSPSDVDNISNTELQCGLSDQQRGYVPLCHCDRTQHHPYGSYNNLGPPRVMRDAIHHFRLQQRQAAESVPVQRRHARENGCGLDLSSSSDRRFDPGIRGRNTSRETGFCLGDFQQVGQHWHPLDHCDELREEHFLAEHHHISFRNRSSRGLAPAYRVRRRQYSSACWGEWGCMFS